MDARLFTELPRWGAWRLSGAYEGFEVVGFKTGDSGTRLEGTTVGVEDGVPWALHYVLDVDHDWHVRRAVVRGHDGTGVELHADGAGAWTVDGEPRPALDGCLDLDLEASAVTNTLPVHRLGLAVDQQGASAAAYIRTDGLVVERLDQTYRRLPDVEGQLRFDYASPRFGYRDTLHVGREGLVVAYPGIGERVPLTG